MERLSVSRRDFLRFAGVVVGSAVLSGCGTSVQADTPITPGIIDFSQKSTTDLQAQCVRTVVEQYDKNAKVIKTVTSEPFSVPGNLQTGENCSDSYPNMPTGNSQTCKILVSSDKSECEK